MVPFNHFCSGLGQDPCLAQPKVLDKPNPRIHTQPDPNKQSYLRSVIQGIQGFNA
jgi:hypothetical protein